MIKLSINFFKQTEKEGTKTSTTDTKENLLKDMSNSSNKIFSAADLWNIQRKVKNSTQRSWAM